MKGAQNVDGQEFKETLKNDFIAKFVMKFLNLTEIPNTIISNDDSKPELTKHNIINANAVIDFLKEKEKIFSILIFSFNTSYEREASAKLFFKTFLNFFFIKKSIL